MILSNCFHKYFCCILHFPQTMQQAVFQTAIQVKQLVIADQSDSFAQSVISDVEGGASVQAQRESEVKASPQTGSIRKHQACTATIILLIIIIILTDQISYPNHYYYCEALANIYSGLRKGVRTFVLYDTGSFTETAWFENVLKSRGPYILQKILDPEAGVIVDLITMKVCALPCIPRIQSRPSGITPICKYKDFVRMVSKLEHC